MINKDEADDKILAVALGHARVEHINDAKEFPEYFRIELKQFFDEYKNT